MTCIGWRELPVFRGGVAGVESRAAEAGGRSLLAGERGSARVSPAPVHLRTVGPERERARARAGDRPGVREPVRGRAEDTGAEARAEDVRLRTR